MKNRMRCTYLSLLFIPFVAFPQESGLLLGVGRSGLAFGDVPSVNGIRFNWADDYLDEVNGLNVTLWKPVSEDWLGTVNGVSFGVVAASGEYLNGISLSPGGVLASEAMNGINVGGLALVSKGGISGINVGGLGVVGQGSVTGITLSLLGTVSQKNLSGFSFAGLGTVAQGSMTGISLAGLGTVAQGDMLGINIAGLGTVAQGDMKGLSFSVLGTVSQGEMFGMNVGGLAIVAQDGLKGISVGGLAAVGQESIAGGTFGGLAVVSQGDIKGLTFSLGKVYAENGKVAGVTFGGYKMEAASIRGINASVIWTESDDLSGLSFAAYNRTYRMQTGIVIGLLNHAADLFGVQLGLLNIVEANPTWARYLPLVNARF